MTDVNSALKEYSSALIFIGTALRSANRDINAENVSMLAKGVNLNIQASSAALNIINESLTKLGASGTYR